MHVDLVVAWCLADNRPGVFVYLFVFVFLQGASRVSEFLKYHGSGKVGPGRVKRFPNSHGSGRAGQLLPGST